MLKIEGLTKSFEDGRKRRLAAVNQVTLSVDEGVFFTLLGPSGCGKTTLLRMIAGIEGPDSGQIAIDRATVFSSDPPINRAPNKRKIGLVFQNFAIWPHMTVLQHVTFPLQMIRKEHGLSRADILKSAQENLAMVQLEHHADKNASLLSGGQKQRLAVARALVAKPKIVLLDEPLSNLDAVLRESLRGELKTLQRNTGITFIYVTHDQDEALAMSDQVGVMRNGKILQVASPQDIYRKPTDAFVAGFVGKGTVLYGSTLNVFLPEQLYADESSFLVRPEKVLVYDSTASKSGLVPGKVATIDFYGDHWRLIIDCLGQAIAAKVSASQTFSVGQKVHLCITPDGIIPLN